MRTVHTRACGESPHAALRSTAMDSREANGRAARWIGIALAVVGPVLGIVSFWRLSKLRAAEESEQGPWR